MARNRTWCVCSACSACSLKSCHLCHPPAELSFKFHAHVLYMENTSFTTPSHSFYIIISDMVAGTEILVPNHGTVVSFSEFIRISCPQAAPQLPQPKKNRNTWHCVRFLLTNLLMLQKVSNANWSVVFYSLQKPVERKTSRVSNSTHSIGKPGLSC